MMHLENGIQNDAFEHEDDGKESTDPTGLTASSHVNDKYTTSPHVENLSSSKEEIRMATWDVFQYIPSNIMNEANENFYEFCNKIFRILTIMVVFLVLLGCAVISKSTLLFTTSQLRLDVQLTCWNETKNNMSELHCVSTPIESPEDTEVYPLQCLNKTTAMTNEPHILKLCDAVTVRWLWALFLIMVTPYALVFLRCLWLVLFKTNKMPSADVMLIVFIQETLCVLGTSIFTFLVLPNITDVIMSLALMTGVGFLPGVLSTLTRPPDQRLWIVHLILDIAAFAAQVSALFFLPVLMISKTTNYNPDLKWAVPVSLVLMSLSWWENYVNEDTKLGPLVKAVVNIKLKLQQTKTKAYLVASAWKIALSFCMLLAFTSRSMPVADLFNWDFSEARCGAAVGPLDIGHMEWDWLAIWGINTGVGVAAYFCTRTAAKVKIQRISYAIPLLLTTPAVFGSLVGMCESWNHDPCIHTAVIPGTTFWQCYPRGGLGALFTESQAWMLIVWWVSQIWIARHIFLPSKERLMKTERLFILPLYDNVIIEQWLMYNRARKEDDRETETNIPEGNGIGSTRVDPQVGVGDLEDDHRLSKARDSTPFIYICATMWHENETEMVMLLKSLFRLDIDQCARQLAQQHMELTDPDYYEFEAHIFFDDAMQDHSLGQSKYKCNQFVTLLVSVIDKAASAAHDCNKKIDAPVRIPTPYGGRLEWTMPGGNKIIAHLKDKAKIRHKKRWSQVMYMYYLLAFKLWAHEPSDKYKQLKAENTFILALDGDVDFQPKALMKLLDLMKKDEKVGAACGRIHPIGSGPMLFYQKFEYALSHWLQKAAEHAFGCVLCSPGCFSLFRGSAIMDNNVMNRYAIGSCKPLHYVQHDQGEDRWLATLLLQQGHHIEYCAASDCYTFAPKSFNEFYNQRRRWMPSTMANILDLILSWKHTIKVNDRVSLLYIMYQAGFLAASILSSGTIFLMIVGALQVALNGAISNWTSLFINLVPVLLFIFICYKAKSSNQLLMAQILTTFYALLQMLVMVAIIIQISRDGPCSPTAIFFVYVGGTFIFAAIIHPHESSCLVHVFIYFVSIPSMYMLLMIYSLTNLHVVSWGTREVEPTPIVKDEKSENEQDASVKQTGVDGNNRVSVMIKKMINKFQEEKGQSSGQGSSHNMTRCPQPTTSDESVKFDDILTKLDDIERKVFKLENSVKTGDDMSESQTLTKQNVAEEEEPPWKVSFSKAVTVKEPKPADACEYGEDNPYWMQDNALGQGPVHSLPQEEVLFFKDLIKTYLYPVGKNEQSEAQMAKELLELRNKISFVYFLLNALFVATIFTFQANEVKISMPWLCGDNLYLEPIGFMFLVIFGLILILQTVGMIFHRTSTFLHIIATTKLRKHREDVVQDAIQLAKDMVETKDGASVDTNSEESKSFWKQQSWKRLPRRKKQQPTVVESLHDAFLKNLATLNDELTSQSATPKDIGKKVTGKSQLRRESVCAINNMMKKGGVVGFQRHVESQV